MEELFKIFQTPGLTILGGVIIFVIGQIILRFIIEPILELNRIRGEIAYSLIFYANVYRNARPEYTDLREDTKMRDDVQKIFREQASRLCPKASIIPWFKIWELLKIVPKFQNVTAAAEELIGLSNSIHDVKMEFNGIRREKIANLLDLKINLRDKQESGPKGI